MFSARLAQQLSKDLRAVVGLTHLPLAAAATITLFYLGLLDIRQAYAETSESQQSNSNLVWSLFTPPVARSSPLASVDPNRGRLLLFGGRDGLGRMNDSWYLDMSENPSWTHLETAGSPPPPREYSAGAFDPVRDRWIILWGYDGVDRINDQWNLDIATSTWSPLAVTGPSPPARYGHTALYDPLGDRVLVFGGSVLSGVSNTVWSLALGTNTWSQLSVAGTPPVGRMWHTAVYDSIRNRMIIFGGLDNNGRNDVWALDLGATPTWSQVLPNGTPPTPRFGHTAIWDGAGDRMVVFGGGSTGIECWELSFKSVPTWAPLPQGARGRISHIAGFDRRRGTMLVFGGDASSPPNGALSDLWSFELSTLVWKQVTPAGIRPPGRKQATLIFDYTRDRVVMFGGNNDFWTYNDTWARDRFGSGWRLLPVGGQLSPGRSGHTAVLDAARDRMVVFGGEGTNEISMLTFSPNPTWSHPSLPGPSARMQHAAIMDPARSRMIVFGGSNTVNSYLNDLWQLNLAGTLGWSPLAATGTAPTPRRGHSAVYDSNQDRMLVFGGFSPSSGYLNDVWALTLSGTPTWVQLSPSGTPPSGRTQQAAIYDPLLNRMVLFGGYNVPSSTHDDVWALNLTGAPTWEQLLPTPDGPRTRSAAAVFFDAQRRHMLVWGGAGIQGGPSTYFDDLWGLALEGVLDAPETHSLSQPMLVVQANPVQDIARFEVRLTQSGSAMVQILDLLGRRVALLHDGPIPVGSTRFTWNCRDVNGRLLSPGIYIVNVNQEGRLTSARLAIVR